MLHDLRYAIRTLAKSRGFTAAAVLTLALGIGATTTIFSVVDAVLLRPLPFRNPDRIVHIPRLPREDFDEWRAQTKTLSHMALYRHSPTMLPGLTDLGVVSGALVSPGFFAVLGEAPLLGRTFEPADEREGSARVIILSHSLWATHFGSDPDVLGRLIRGLTGQPIAVVGVMPPGFAFPRRDTEYWQPLPLTLDATCGTGRLRDGVSLEQANAEAQTLTPRYRQLRDRNIELGLLQERIGSSGSLPCFAGPSVWRTLTLPVVAVGFLLLLACVNVANLLLARAVGRQPEIAIRMALGAGRVRLIRLLLTESLLLALLGGTVGSLLAFGAIRVLPALERGTLTRLQEVHVDVAMLTFTLGVSVLSAVAFGLAPAVTLSRAHRLQALRRGATSAPAGVGPRGRTRTGGALAIVQVALALVLLIGAGLFINTFRNLTRITGYDPTNVLTFGVLLTRGDTEPQDQGFNDLLLSRVQRVPGVHSTGVTSNLPTDRSFNWRFSVVGHPRNSPPEEDVRYRQVDGAHVPYASVHEVSPGYLDVMQIGVVRGRGLTDRDGPGQQPVMVVNETFVRWYLEGDDPLFTRVEFADKVWDIVGVVEDVDIGSIRRSDYPPGERDLPAIYVSYRQYLRNEGRARFMWVAVRTAMDQAAPMSAIRRDLRAIDPLMPIYEVAMMDERMLDLVAQPRFVTALLGAVAAVALVLASLGIYGLLAYSVNHRTREIGIRMALGARRADVLRTVLGQGLTVTLAGVAVGLAGAVALTRYVESFLFEVTPLDPLTMVSASLVLVTVALVACYLPARRATKVDPAVALRAE